MFNKKLLALLATTIFANSESRFKKSIHYYVGVSRFFSQPNSTKIEIEKFEDSKKDDDFTPGFDADDQEIDPIKSQLYMMYFSNNRPEPLFSLLKQATTSLQNSHILTHGFIASVYIGEIMDVFSYGLCISNQISSNDCINFNPQTSQMQQTDDNNTQNLNKVEELDDNNRYQDASIVLKRNMPLMVGGFVQVQDDELDCYTLAGRINLMCGITNVYGGVHEQKTFIDDNLIQKSTFLATSVLTLSLSFSVIFKIADFEFFIMAGCSWAPTGISFTQKGFPNAEEPSTVITSRFKTNHIKTFLCIGGGFSFD